MAYFCLWRGVFSRIFDIIVSIMIFWHQMTVDNYDIVTDMHVRESAPRSSDLRRIVFSLILKKKKKAKRLE